MCYLSLLVSMIVTTLMLTRCTTSTDSTLFVMGVGGIIGAGAGAVAGHNGGTPKEGAAVGLAVGSALGGLMGYLKHKEDQEQKNKIKVGTEGSAPILSRPNIERVWVGPRIENNTYIEGHYQFVIKKPSRWSPESTASKTSSQRARNK
ncbi:MAG: glycine zipper domain-containing protein [Proteobacteria bacterium]|nr:glycine zipper domain-containing protein [Pseudomonadota bacterium]